jgi:hypothetical protein
MARLFNASLHRFHEFVALSLPGKGETLYFNAKEAKELAKALNKIAKSIDTESFLESEVGTITVALLNEGKRS